MTDALGKAAAAVCLKLPGVSPGDCVQTRPRTGNYADRPPCTPANCLAADIASAADGEKMC